MGGGRKSWLDPDEIGLWPQAGEARRDERTSCSALYLLFPASQRVNEVGGFALIP